MKQLIVLFNYIQSFYLLVGDVCNYGMESCLSCPTIAYSMADSSQDMCPTDS